MSEKDKINNIKLDKTLFKELKKLNNRLYQAFDYDGNSSLIDIYTNKVLLDIGKKDIIAFQRLDADLVYATEKYDDNVVSRLINGQCKCVLKFNNISRRTPKAKILDNGIILVYLWINSWGNAGSPTNIVVYDNIQEKVLTVINNVYDVKLFNSLVVNYYEQDKLVSKSIDNIVKEYRK